MANVPGKRSRRQVSIDDGDSIASPSTFKRAKHSQDTSDTIKLDPEGDAIFAIKKPASDQEETTTFLVSSKVLSLASPVFCKMFSPQFQEGTRVRNGECPRITLEDDDPTAMDVILRILHFQSDHVSLQKSRAEILSIAVHSDKYDCRGALKAWISTWWHANKLHKMSHLTSQEIGFTLLAAYMFRYPHLPKVATNAVRYLKPDFLSAWDKHERLSLLPESLTEVLYNHLAKRLDYVQGALQAVEKLLQRSGKGYLLPGYRECPPCGLTFRDQDGNCSCGKRVQYRYCTPHYRVAKYAKVLRAARLYPLVECFRDSSLVEIADAIGNAYTNHGHTCEAGTQCPLLIALGGLRDDVTRAKLGVEQIEWSYDSGQGLT